MTTTTNSWALHIGLGSKAGYAAGYFYLFFSDGTNIKYVSTSDSSFNPTTFGTAVTVKAGSDGSYFQVIFQDPYVYMVSVTPDSKPIKFRRGLCSGGSISWDTEVTGPTGTQMRVTGIDITDEGYVLVAYYADNGAYVSKNANKDGTWSTASGYPKRLDDADSVNHMVKVLDMGSGNWYGMYCGVTGGHIYGRYWNGSTLATKEQCTDVITSAVHRWDARAVGSTIFLAWNGQSGNFYLYRRVRSGGSWGTTATIWTGGGSDYDKVPAVSVNKDLGDVYVAWQNYPSSAHVYYQKYTGATSSWGSTVDAVTESALPNPYQIVGISRAMNNSLVFAYLSGSSPYTLDILRFESLTSSSGGTGPSGGMMMYGGIGII